MSKIRILRVIEYIYGSVEIMDADQKKWNGPANGSISNSPGKLIRSTTFPLEVLAEPPGANATTRACPALLMKTDDTTEKCTLPNNHTSKHSWETE